jgi:hypothetical protein
MQTSNVTPTLSDVTVTLERHVRAHLEGHDRTFSGARRLLQATSLLTSLRTA